MAYVDMTGSEYFYYKALLTYQNMQQLAANDETRLSKLPDYDSGWFVIGGTGRQIRAKTHGCGTLNTLVYLERNSNQGYPPYNVGLGHYDYGRMAYGGNETYAYGFWFQNKTATTIEIVNQHTTAEYGAHSHRVLMWILN